MILSIIAAAAENNVLGKGNQLIWKISDDTAYFKEKTLHHTVIMGRKTFDSMGKPLPKRRNIIVTRRNDLHIPSAEVVTSIEEALSLSAEEKEVFLIGGAELYKLGLPLAQKIYLTRVYARPEGDAFFPEIDPKEWVLKSEEKHPSDERNQYPFSFLIYERA